MPWIGQVSAAMEAWYPGIRGGAAIANILFGLVNPSAKLPLTFAKSEADLPHPQLTRQPPPASIADVVEPFPGFKDNTTRFEVSYDEGLMVGYKWYDAKHKTPLFPFGFGLSYTTYKYSNLKTSKDSVGFDVTNTGARAGAEIAEVYATLPQASGEQFNRLVAWEKVRLEPGESKSVTLRLDPFYLSIFNADKDAWELVPGEYIIQAGASSRDLALRGSVQLD
jgi:beta-glucosidase